MTIEQTELFYYLASEDDLAQGQAVAAALTPLIVALLPKPML